ncbi:MAG: hypothetical protein Q9187_001762 [Circinaria calcarea]
MAIQEEPRAQSIQARIAALKLDQVGKAPVTATPNNLVPRSAHHPASDLRRRNSANVPVEQNFSSLNNGVGNEPNGTGNEPNGTNRLARAPPEINSPPRTSPPPPRLPPRKASAQKSPALPPRRPSEQLSRRDSTESISSVISTVSTTSALSNGTRRISASMTPSIDGSRVRVPVYDPSTLPPLPTKRLQHGKEQGTIRTPLKGTKSTSSVTTLEVFSPPRTPALPQRPLPREGPREPDRKFPPREPPPMPARSLSSPRTNGQTNGRTPSPSPPAIPTSSRPDLSKIMATKPKLPAASSTLSTPANSPITSCLKCRDFSGVDNHAALFPRETVPSLDWLAIQLTSPFPSLTDKARVIFTWLHHNISYDVEAFFNNCVRPSTPASTLSTGLAVCEGYAGLFTTLASKAGLESVVIGGHGKGFGTVDIPLGAPVPPESSNHAWNAVRIDNGEWKLIECCWGSGSVNGKGHPYHKHFTSSWFTRDNNEFGLAHFPTNKNYFFRTDGRAHISWEEYILGDQGGPHVQVYSDVAPTEGLSVTAFLPKYKAVSTNRAHHPSSRVRFQFEKVCEHWDPIRNGPGKPYVYVLATAIGQDGRAADYIPFDNNGMYWWLDVPLEKLGRKGQMCMVYTVASVNGKDGRGLSKDEYLAAKGRSGMGFGGVCQWDLV